MNEPPVKILLKARPTAAQLRNRFAPPTPDGVELYIHEDDVRPHDWLSVLRPRFEALRLPRDCTWIVEGPVWSLDGELFGICRNRDVDRELTRRLVQLATTIGATAVNVHCVDGSYNAGVLSEESRARAQGQAAPFLSWYVGVCQDEGLLPLIENVPPICRMRRAAYVYSPIGVKPDDLLFLTAAAPGLGVTLDTSHAQLAVNAFRGATPELAATGDSGLRRAARYYQSESGPSSLEGYIRTVLPAVRSVHVSNAAGLLAEGLPYAQGDADLDTAVRLLATSASYFVTEPIDADEDTAPLKREMQRRLADVLGVRLPAEAAPSRGDMA